jgi:DNA-binding response OmpR family regulator
LLDLSRLETGKLKLEVTEGDLTGLIRSIILSFLSLAESKKINYSHELDESSAPLLFDRDKIEKILTNLVSNALKFTPEGGSVRVTLKYIQQEGSAPGSRAEIRVGDTGPGIPDENLDKIFDRFYQVSGSDSRGHEGTGIGLALAKELVEFYRGEIRVESSPGQGSTFIVDLPVSLEQFGEAELITSPGKNMETDPSEHPDSLEYGEADIVVQTDQFNNELNDKHIVLIVEDNPDLRDYIAQNLLNDYHILQAENGNEGLQKAIESIPDLVISDLMMPEMDGIEMCQLLKADHRTNHIPLIMLTAKADRDSKLESLETGADDFIVKPFDAEELAVRVKNLIKQRQKLREKFRKELITEPEGTTVTSTEDKLLDKILEICNRHLADSDFNVDRMSGNLNMSRAQLHRKVHAITGHAPMELLQTIRLKKAALLFESGERNISQVAYQVGFNNMSYFAKCFRRLYKMNPSAYLKSRN